MDGLPRLYEVPTGSATGHGHWARASSTPTHSHNRVYPTPQPAPAGAVSAMREPGHRMSTLDTVRGRHRRPATRKPGRRTSRLDPYPVMRRNRLAHFAVDGWVICKRNLTRTSRMPN